MSRKIRSLYLKFLSSILLSVLLLCSGCKNFLEGEDFVVDIENVIQYANANKYSLRVKADDKTGTIISVRDVQVKVTDEFDIAFQPAEGYTFLKWSAVNIDNEAISMENYVDIYEPTKLESKVKFIKASDSILIKPLCEQNFELTGTNVSNQDTIQCRNTSVIINFNNALASDNDLSKIKFSVSGLIDAKDYFSTPVIDGDRIVIASNPNKLIPVEENTTRTVTITLPASLYYQGKYSNVSLNKDYEISYQIDSSTVNKASITFTYDDAKGTLKVNGELPALTAKEYYIGQKIRVTYKNNSDYYFNGWTVKGATEDAILISYPENAATNGFDASTDLATADISIINSVQNVEIAPNVTLIPTLNVTIEANHGRSNPVSNSSADFQEKRSYPISFDADNSFCFTEWIVEDANHPWLDVSSYIEIENPYAIWTATISQS